MRQDGKLVVDAPVSWLEALIMGWALAYCGLKSRCTGRYVLISKECW